MFMSKTSVTIQSARNLLIIKFYNNITFRELLPFKCIFFSYCGIFFYYINIVVGKKTYNFINDDIDEK